MRRGSGLPRGTWLSWSSNRLASQENQHPIIRCWRKQQETCEGATEDTEACTLGPLWYLRRRTEDCTPVSGIRHSVRRRIRYGRPTAHCPPQCHGRILL